MSLSFPVFLFVAGSPGPVHSPHTGFVLSIIAIGVSVVSAVAGVGHWRAIGDQIRTQNLLQINSFLHQTEYREARHALQGAAIEQVDMRTIRQVCSSFDFAALFIKNGLIKKKLFVRYWRPTLQYLRKHLNAVSHLPIVGEVTVEEYYEWPRLGAQSLMERS